MDKKIGERIRELRETKNYTREAFAEKIDISVKFLYEIETGRKGFSVEKLIKLAEAFYISSDYLIFGKNKSVEKYDEYEEYKEYKELLCALELLEPRRLSKVINLLLLVCDFCSSV